MIMSQKSRFESEIINAFYEFLLKNGLKESTCNDYCKRILAICKQYQIAPEELFEGRARYSIDDLIGIYTNHPEMKEENAQKHGAPLSALKKFKNFMEIRRSGHLQNKIVGERIYIKYAPIYQSFVIINKHISGFTIQDRHFELVYEQNERVCDIVEKQIDDKNYSDLIAVMRRYKNYLNDSKKSIWEIFPHGGVSAFEYRFEDKFSVYGGVWPLFVGGKPADEATIEFKRVIENIIHQAGGKPVPVSASPAGNSVSVPTTSAPVAKKPAAGKTDLLTDEFWGDFAQFLRENGLSESSIRCYITQYLKNAFKNYLGIDILDFSGLDDETKIDTVKELHSKLSKAILLGTGLDSKKTQQNYSSAVVKLEVFLDERFSELSDGLPAASEEIPIPEEVPVSEEEPVSTSDKAPMPEEVENVYPYKDLLFIFKQRLITQDRSYKDTYLPCRLLNKIFSKNPRYKKLLNDVLDGTIFLLGDGKKTTLKEIDEIWFSGGHVWVILKNGTKEILYTEVYKKKSSAGLEKMSATRVRELSLDHDEPLAKLFNRLLSTYPSLKRLSDEYIAYRDSLENNPGKSRLATGFYRDKYAAFKLDKEQLLNDLCDLYKKISLTIMYGRYNSSKNSNFAD